MVGATDVGFNEALRRCLETVKPAGFVSTGAACYQQILACTRYCDIEQIKLFTLLCFFLSLQNFAGCLVNVVLAGN